MSTALHYKSNLRDIFFNLFEYLEVQNNSLGKAPFSSSLDEETAREILKGIEKICSTELAASFVDSDRIALELDKEGNVKIPASLRRSIEKYQEAGFHRLELPEHLGGIGGPPSMHVGELEMVAGSNPCSAFYLFGTFVARVLERLGTADQKARFAQRIVDNNWGGTMVLTEPDAGSDVGAGKARAIHKGGEEWHITGTKRFITNGDFDVPENIVHLVLARPEGAGAGTKGLSLFIVPKFWVNEDGTLGERNGVVVTNLEKKMGIKGSATCELTFGDGKPARGILVGEVHDGIRQMFHVIEQARMAVGIKSMATLSTAYLNSLEYAKTRVQGPDLARATDKASERVRIIQHPDVRRMLMTQKAHAEGMRALCFFTAHIQDQVEILGGHGSNEAKSLDRLNDMLLPLVKGYCSEKTYELLGSASLQIYGGSGYCQDYPIEQYIRDQKIDSLYEGTTQIQALDLLFRKVAKDGGQTLGMLVARIEKTIASEAGGAELAKERELLKKAIGDVQTTFMALMGKVGESVYHAGLVGNRVLFALAELTIGWLLVDHAALAIANKAKKPADADYYDGKVASARFFCRNVLPGLTLTRKMVEASELGITELREEVFG
jgi:alkylation response protein AidB-like acyl-CoA dehydrogenase